jgi:tRNA threonylcarbamoyladenosine biosynthesis protein TsaB
MRILAVDTTAHFGSLALYNDGQILETLLHAPEGFGTILFDRITQLLKQAACEIGDIDLFAGAAGPGSFTGVRLGLTAIKGLAEAAGKPAFGISNLQALAEYGRTPLCATVIDARRGEIYGALYDASGAVIQAEAVLPFLKWLDHLPDGEIGFISPDFGPFLPSLRGTRFENSEVIEQRAIAAAVAFIAMQRLRDGDHGDPAAIDANYVRRSDAELLFK